MSNLRYFFEIWPWLGFFAAVVLSWYFYLKARNKERMALIEKGADVSDIYSKQEIRFRFSWLKTGILITGIGFGLTISCLVIFFLANQGFDIEDEPIVLLLVLISIFLFGGISMIVAHFADRPRQK